MKASTGRDGSLFLTAPAWGGHSSTGVGGRSGVRDQHYFGSTDESKPPHSPKDKISSEATTDGNAKPTQKPRHPLTSQEPIDILASAQELDKTRLEDLEADRSHIQELRALVVGFLRQGCGGPREAFMADLLVQVKAWYA